MSGAVEHHVQPHEAVLWVIEGPGHGADELEIEVGMVRILELRKQGDDGCAITLEVHGSTYEIVARGISHDERVGGMVRSFEPWRVFQEIPLSTAQLRALTHTSVEFHEGASFVLPMDVPA